MKLKDILNFKKRRDVLGRPAESKDIKLPPYAIFDEIDRLHKGGEFVDAVIDITYGAPIEFPPNPEQIKRILAATPDDLWQAYLMVVWKDVGKL